MTGPARPAVVAMLLAGLAAPVHARDVLDLQASRQATQVAIPGGSARLVDLAPAIGAWYLLTVATATGPAASWHLENRRPRAQSLALDAARAALVVHADDAADCVVELAHARALRAARESRRPFAPLCDGRIAVRNATPGRRTALEATTQFLRDHVWGGERFVGFVKHAFYEDAFALHAGAPGTPIAREGPPTQDAPPAPLLTEAARTRALVPDGLALDIGPARRGLRPGAWWPVSGRPGVFLSALTPASLAAGDGWHADPVEADALDYFVAFDLERFELGFALGTDHPRLGWSQRAPQAMRDAASPGPDGIDSAAPLVRTGIVDPASAGRLVATFAGGFKREHGAFRYGRLATVNHASHYGFVEQGVVFSTLQPGLSTLYATADGRIDLRTWPGAAAPAASTLRFARQNGVPLVESDGLGRGRLGALVGQWGAGNWSGSVDEQQRTLRSGACIVEDGRHRFLVYGWFSTATPETMARAFLALGCRDAMHLDMNALEHTYLALYVPEHGRLGVQHLAEGMAVLDGSVGGALAPRFVGAADDRDFFYVLEKARAR